jgi:heme a synthase
VGLIFAGIPVWPDHGHLMAMTRFQKLAAAALVSVLVLMFVGPTVRVTGAGMGCPDWPMCWGRLIPPTSVEDVDFAKLPIEKFQRKAVRMGRDPATVTEETLRKEFNPRHVWTEFANRLTSLPVGFFSLATFIAAFWQREKRPRVFWMAFTSLAAVLINAWMGARVVYSGLSPGVLTAHLALAMGLLGSLVYCAWRGTDSPWRIQLDAPANGRLRLAVSLLLAVILLEGIFGSQVREITDEMERRALHLDR